MIHLNAQLSLSLSVEVTLFKPSHFYSYLVADETLWLKQSVQLMNKLF